MWSDSAWACMGMHGHAWACMGPVYDLYTPRRARPRHKPRARGRSGSVMCARVRRRSMGASMGVDRIVDGCRWGVDRIVDGRRWASMGRRWGVRARHTATTTTTTTTTGDDGRRRRSTHGDSRTRRHRRDTHRRSDTRATRATRATTTTTTTTWLGRAVGSVSVSVSVSI